MQSEETWAPWYSHTSPVAFCLSLQTHVLKNCSYPDGFYFEILQDMSCYYDEGFCSCLCIYAIFCVVIFFSDQMCYNLM